MSENANEDEFSPETLGLMSLYLEQLEARPAPPPKKANPIPAGHIFTVTTGCYSEYSVHGVFRTIAEVDPDALVAQWLAAHEEQRRPWGFDEAAFLAWVSRQGLIEPVDSLEWHVGDQGEVSLSSL